MSALRMCQWAAMVLMAACFFGCASPQQSAREKAKSSATRLASIAAEGELFLKFVTEGHSTAAFASGHALYLHKLAQEASDELSDMDRSEPGAAQTAELRLLAGRLAQATGVLATHDYQPAGSIQLVREFAQIRNTAEQIRQGL